MDNFAQTNLFIFNRYGKLLKQLNTSDIGWNGTLMEFHYLLMIIFKLTLKMEKL
jgi:gliding motility-associated-like protein